MAWHNIKTAPKNRKLLLGYFNRCGKWRTVIGCFYTKGNLPLADESDRWDEGDEQWAPEDWYEESETADYLKPLHDKPTHWMVLPDAPDMTA